MMSVLKTISTRTGIDGAIFYSSLARVFQAVGGIITLFFVAKFLTTTEQGFYYTFGSVLAIQVFFELGLNGIITQYVAHEAAFLTWETETHPVGSEYHLSRLSSLLHFAIRWYLFFAGILTVVLIISGIHFFTRYDKSTGSVEWIAPWIIITISTTVAFMINPLLAFFEGLGMVKKVAKIRLLQQIITVLCIWGTLFSGSKLYASGISTLIGLVVVACSIAFDKQRIVLVNLWKISGKARVNYRSEIFPYQWKIALSWVSGYFIFQLFNPVLFATEGAIVAGQMGMTLAALNGILSLSISWMSTKVPLYSRLIAQGNFNSLDLVFNKTLNQSVLINGGCLLLFVGVVTQIQFMDLALGKRFLPVIPLIFMSVPIFINQFVASWATYLRCHKQEPFLILSLVSGTTICLSTIVLGKYFGVLGMTSGYCFLTVLFGIGWAWPIFKMKRMQWHT